MKPSIFKMAKQKRELIDIEEAFNLWNLLGVRYRNIYTIRLFCNFVHDLDLFNFMETIKDDFEKQVKILEKETERFEIKVPRRPPESVKISDRVEEFSDQYIYREVFNLLKEDLFTLSRTVRTSTTNDRLRRIFRRFLKNQLYNFDDFLKFGKLKGWLDTAPTYKTARPVRKERLDVVEAYHLWDHLNLRYDQIQLTQLFFNFAHDEEFRAILNSGLETLRKEVNILEEQMNILEVPLPERPPYASNATIDPETIEDIFMYRVILTGIQNAMDLHLRAVVETTRNDSIRKMFTQFLSTEVEVFDKYLRYGKVKGWLHPAPLYTEPR